MPRLTELFGDSVQVKVIEFLLLNPNKLFSQSQISREADCSGSSVGRVLEPLARLGVIKSITLPGEAKIIALNTESPITIALLKFKEELKDSR